MIPNKYDPRYFGQCDFLECDKHDPTGENGILYSSELAVIGGNEEYREHVRSIALWYLFDIKTGMFKARPDDRDYISPDNLIGLCALSNCAARLIWGQLKLNKFRYDNLNPTDMSIYRTMPPRCILFAGIAADSTLMRFIFPLLLPILIIPLLKAPTTGKLLTWLILYSQKDYKWEYCLTHWILSGIINWYDAFLIYFKNDVNHPLVQEIKRIYK